MKLLLDANLSPSVAAALIEAGYEDTEHVGELGMLTSSDDEIFDYAADSNAVVITADSDFAMLLALRRAKSPSVILLRGVADLVPSVHIRLLLANLPSLLIPLGAGAIVSLSPERIRIRDLPIR